MSRLQNEKTLCRLLKNPQLDQEGIPKDVPMVSHLVGFWEM